MTSTLPVGILLAAGRGRRFDPVGIHNKLLQSVTGAGPVVVASARALLAVLPRVIAVVREEDSVAVALRAAGCEVTICPDAALGMAHSLVHAIEHSRPHAQSWLIALGDMPYVRTSTITAMCDALAAGAQLVAPVSNGRRGNPVGFGADHLPALLALHGDQGARAIIAANQVSEIAVDDPGIFQDIDVPADLSTIKSL